ncbi:MAG: hypothetical protein SVK08_00085 [Halobacteriota archaeon]|nr:hypothetical protein [Halobacteriota archaeon]
MSLFPYSKATTKLSMNVDAWDQEIIQEVSARYPEFSDKILSIEYTNLDKDQGTATGYIALEGGIRLPILVRRYEMYPIDIYIDEDTNYGYLTRSTPEKILKQDPPYNRISLSEIRNLGLSPMSHQIHRIKTAEDKSEMAELRAAFSEMGQEKLADMFSGNDSPPSEMVVYYEMPNPFSAKVIRTSDDRNLTVKEAAEEIGDHDRLEELLTDGETFRPPSIPMYKHATSVAIATDKANRKFKGHLFTLKNITTDKDTGDHIVVTNDGTYSTAKPEEVYGGDLQFTPVKPVIGDTILVLANDNVAYGPFRMESVSNIEGEKHIGVFDKKRNKSYNIVFVENIKSPQVLSTEKIAVPFQWRASKLSTEIEKKAESPHDKIITVTKMGKKFSISDPGLLPPSMRGEPMTKTSTIAVLSALGMTEDGARETLTNMKSGSISIGLSGENSGQTKTAVELDPDIERIRGIAIGISKHAEEVTQEQDTIDLILGLGLITKANLSRYRAMMPHIKKTVSDLSKILIAKRMNESKVTIPESSLTSTLEGLTEIMEELGRI